MSWLYFAGHSKSHGPFSQDESFLIALLAKACTGAPGVLATAGWTWLSIRQSSVRNAGGGSAMISNSFGEEFGWQATKLSARNPTGRLNNFRRVPPRRAPKSQDLGEQSRRVALSGLAGCEARKFLLEAQFHQALLSERPSQRGSP